MMIYLADPFVLSILLVLWIMIWRLRRARKRIVINEPERPLVAKSRQEYRHICHLPSPRAKMRYLKELNPYLFEELLLSAFEQQGYRVIRNRRYAQDGGVDGRVYVAGKLHYIQAKRYQNVIEMKHIEQFIHLCHRDRVRGYFIHTGKTSPIIKQRMATCSWVEMISGPRLISLFCTKM